MMDNKKFYRRPVFWLMLIFAYSVILSRYSHVSIYDQGFGRGWYYGDGFSEKNVESASRFYMEKGFRPNHGLPTYLYEDSIAGNEYVYTHYPPMAEWIGGLIASATHHYSDKAVSILPLILSLLLFFFIFSMLARWLDGHPAAFVGASILVLSNYFICWADDAHQHLYVEFFRWIFVFLWWLYLNNGARKKYIILILAFCYGMMCLLSYEPYVYIAIIIIGFPLALRQKLLRWEVVVLLIVPVLAFGLRLYLNACYLGGFDLMLKDMKGALLNRTGQSGAVSELQHAMAFSDYFWLLPKTRLHRLGHFYIFPSLVVVALAIMGLIQLKRYNPSVFRIAIVIYLAAISWVFVMPQHALIHIFTLRHIAIFIGLVIGFGLIQYRTILIRHWKERKYWFLAGHAVLISYTLFYAAVNTIYFVYLKYGLLYPHLGHDNFELFDHFLM